VILHEHRPNSDHQLSQLLFYENGTVYNQSLILNADYGVDPTLLAEQGLPYYASSWVVYLLSMNLGLAATFTHLLLWNRDDLRGAWQWISPSNLLKRWQDFRLENVNLKFWQDDGMREQPQNAEELDPHYVQMLKVSFSVSVNPINEWLTVIALTKYPDVPDSWYHVVFVLSSIVTLFVIYKSNSTLPWWGFVIAVILAIVSILFIGALYAITGLIVSIRECPVRPTMAMTKLTLCIETFVQMIAGYLHPGKPMANMYFILYSSSESTSLADKIDDTDFIRPLDTVSQATLLLRDLKIAQCKLLGYTAEHEGSRFLQTPNSHLVLHSLPRSSALSLVPS
jgi:hypothetical protein